MHGAGFFFGGICFIIGSFCGIAPDVRLLAYDHIIYMTYLTDILGVWHMHGPANQQSSADQLTAAISMFRTCRPLILGEYTCQRGLIALLSCAPDLPYSSGG